MPPDASSQKVSMMIRLLFLIAFMVFPAGCGNSGSGSNTLSPNSAISGKVVGVNPSGAMVSLFDSAGVELASNTTPLDADGDYQLQVPTPIPDAEFFIVQVTRNGRSLRALVTGYFGQNQYAGEDSLISADTEAAVMLCSLGQNVSIYDYTLFLNSSENGIFDPNLPDSCRFPYREVIGELSQETADYFDGDLETLPDEGKMVQMILVSNHTLGASLPTDMPSGSEVLRALATPDGNARVILGYDPAGSYTDGTVPVQVTAASHEDGSFRWNTYRMDLGNNVLKSATVRILEKSPPGAHAATVLNVSPVGPEPRIVSADAVIPEAGGVLEAATSNVPSLIDPDGSGLSIQADNINGAFATTFLQQVTSTGVEIHLGLQPVGGEITPLETIPVGSGKTYTGKVISLNQADHQDRLIIASIQAGKTVLYALEDFIDLTRYQPQIPMLAAYSLSQTRAGSEDMYNSLLDSHDVNRQPVDAGNVYSHYILDVDRLLLSGAVPGWKNTQYGSHPIGDGHGRIPLIFVHGWQGNVGYRSSARLSDWKQSPVLNLYGFISFYMSTPKLNQKYHLYVMRWPSFKHVEYNGQLFGALLNDVRDHHPQSDLGLGMTDSRTGVVVMTHSTGGIVTRSAVETHLAFAGDGENYTFLRKAILLASPNHGTPGAVNTWPNNWSKLTNMDLGTQATSDLEWDSFDEKANLYFSLGAALVGHHFSYTKDRSQNRWPADGENVRDFDLHYLNMLGNMDAATYNPWLLWFTKNFAGLKSDLSSKYIFYSGWTRIVTNPGNFVNNNPSLGYTQTILSMAGYHNDSVLPVCSNLMATATDQKGFYLPAPDPLLAITQDWYPTSTLYGFETLGRDWNVIVIGSGKDHPLGVPFRLIWDFDHTQVRAGALSRATPEDLSSLIDQPLKTSVTVKDDFWDRSYRRGYLRGAVTRNTGVTPSDDVLDDMTNRLKADPFFLILEKDLMDVAG